MYNFKSKNLSLMLLWNVAQTKMPAKDGRKRHHFIDQLIKPLIEQLEKDRTRLLQEFSTSAVSVEDGNIKYDFDQNGRVLYEKEATDLMLEEVVIEFGTDKIDLFLAFKYAVLNSEIDLNGEESRLYDEICIAIEAVQL